MPSWFRQRFGSLLPPDFDQDILDVPATNSYGTPLIRSPFDPSTGPSNGTSEIHVDSFEDYGAVWFGGIIQFLGLFFLGGGAEKQGGTKIQIIQMKMNENDPNLQPNIKKGLFLTCNSCIKNLGIFFSTWSPQMVVKSKGSVPKNGYQVKINYPEKRAATAMVVSVKQLRLGGNWT